MNSYKIEIIETLSKVVEIKANSVNEALNKIEDSYKKEEIVLSSENYLDTNFYMINQENIIEEKYRLTNEIIDYLIEEEKKHFEEFEEKPENHIYKKLLRLKEIV